MYTQTRSVRDAGVVNCKQLLILVIKQIDA